MNSSDPFAAMFMQMAKVHEKVEAAEAAKAKQPADGDTPDTKPAAEQSAAETLADMFAENHRTEMTMGRSRETKKDTPEEGPAAEEDRPAIGFNLDSFLTLRSELSGYFKHGVDLPCTVGGGENVYGTGWDPEHKVLRIVDELPWDSGRTAGEVCRAAQFAAIARDDPKEGPPTDSVTNKVISTYISWEYAHRCLDPDTAVLPFLVLSEDETLFKAWKKTTPSQRIAELAEGAARWDDPNVTIKKLKGMHPALCCAKDLVVSDGEAVPLVPTAFHKVELLRQRLLRGVVDGAADGVIKSAQSLCTKRLKRCAERPEAVLLPYFGEERTAKCLKMLEKDAKEVRGNDLLLLLQMESVVSEVTTPSLTL